MRETSRPSPTIKIPGWYRYFADVMFPRRRNDIRVGVYDMTLYEIPDLSWSDVAKDAVVVRQVPGDPGSLATCTGWDEKLWSPMRRGSVEEYQKDPKEFTVDDYRSKPTRAAVHFDDPVTEARSNGQNVYGLYRDPGDLPDSFKKICTEDNLTGATVLWNNKPQALEQHLAAARNIIAIDGMMYVRRVEPHWKLPLHRLLRDANHVELDVEQSSLWKSSPGAGCFRLDRLQALSDWYAAQSPKFPLVLPAAEILQADPNFLRLDSVSATLYQTFLPRHANSSLPTGLPPEVLSAWVSLIGFAAKGGRLDGLQPDAIEPALKAFSVLAAAHADRGLAPEHRNILADAIVSNGCLSQISFELDHGYIPPTQMTAADDAALTALAS